MTVNESKALCSAHLRAAGSGARGRSAFLGQRPWSTRTAKRPVRAVAEPNPRSVQGKHSAIFKPNHARVRGPSSGARTGGDSTRSLGERTAPCATGQPLREVRAPRALSSGSGGGGDPGPRHRLETRGALLGPPPSAVPRGGQRRGGGTGRRPRGARRGAAPAPLCARRRRRRPPRPVDGAVAPRRRPRPRCAQRAPAAPRGGGAGPGCSGGSGGGRRGSVWDFHSGTGKRSLSGRVMQVKLFPGCFGFFL